MGVVIIVTSFITLSHDPLSKLLKTLHMKALDVLSRF